MNKRDKINHKKLLGSLEEAIRNPKILNSRAKSELTNTLQREALGTFLLTETMNYLCERKGEAMSFNVCKNLQIDRHDGMILIEPNNRCDEQYIEIEQVSLSQFAPESKYLKHDTDISEYVIKEIQRKHDKNYANPKRICLNVFLDVKGITLQKKLKAFLKNNKVFAFYYLTVLSPKNTTKNKYLYTVSDVIPERDRHLRISVEIDNGFSGWRVYG